MIILRLRGGLGNQLFQFATAKALAKYHNAQLKIDDYTYTINNYRKIELSKFGCQFEIASRKEVHRFTGSFPLTRILHKVTNYRWNASVFAQPYYHFYEGFFDLPADIYLSGYFQSEKYFELIKDQIKESLIPNTELSIQNMNVIKEINDHNSVSVHIRRGDYINNPDYANFFGALPIDYYKQSVNHINKKMPGARFYVFSDNTKWCAQNLDFIENIKIIEHNQGDDSYLDLWLMAQCQHHIIANSSFSWWGAWLGKNPKKIVIAPKNWFKSPHYQGKNRAYYSRYYDTKDLLPDAWILL